MSNNNQPAVERARNAFDPGWTPERSASVRARLARTLQQRKSRPIWHWVGSAAAAAVLLVGVAAAVRLVPSGEGAGERDHSAAAPLAQQEIHPGRTVRFEDGSLVELLDPATSILPRDSKPASVRVVQTGGAAMYRVAKVPYQAFTVLVGVVTIQVRGTVFRVVPVRRGAHVSVHEGRVAVVMGTQERELGPGESGLFDPDADALAGASSSAQTEVAPNPNAASGRPSAVDLGWREMARKGDYKGAYGLLKESGMKVADTPAELMLAADAARLSGHPGEAAVLLESVLRHGASPQAGVAAFTLGRLYLDKLGRPAQAATAFALCRQLAGGGALGEMALARSVDAQLGLGNQSEAKRLAEEYLRSYPNGSYASRLRSFAQEQGAHP